MWVVPNVSLVCSKQYTPARSQRKVRQELRGLITQMLSVNGLEEIVSR